MCKNAVGSKTTSLGSVHILRLLFWRQLSLFITIPERKEEVTSFASFKNLGVLRLLRHERTGHGQLFKQSPNFLRSGFGVVQAWPHEGTLQQM